MTVIGSIDGLARRVYLHSDTVGASVNPIDIYREMRALRRSDESLRKYDLFMRASGNDPKGSGKFTERYVTLLLGTRVVPFDTSHELTVTGTVITDEGTEGVAAFDRGPLTASTIVHINYVPPQVEVITVTGGSGLSEDQDIRLSQIHGQVRREIFTDTSSVVNGNGYQQSPYNNVTDAIDDAESSGITALVVLADLSLDRTIKNFTVTGIGTPTVSLNGHDVKGSKFIECGLEGAYVNRMQAVSCTLLSGSFLNGDFTGCIQKGDSTCVSGSTVVMESCLSGVAGLGRPSVSMSLGGTCKLSVRAQKGGLDIRDCNQATDEATIEMLPGSVSLATSCTDGTIVVRGVGILADDSTGSTVVDEIVHPLTHLEFSTIAKYVWEYLKSSATLNGSIGEHVSKNLLTFRQFIGLK